MSVCIRCGSKMLSTGVCSNPMCGCRVKYVYYGSDIVVTSPDAKPRRFTKDFGYGFYVTSIKGQAEIWAHKKHRRVGVVSVYEYTELPEYSKKVFSKMTDEWLDFIVDCRLGLSHKYDIVEGPMADDIIYAAVNDYIEGVISRKAFWALCEFRHPTHQIVLCNDAVIKGSLKFIESYEVR